MVDTLTDTNLSYPPRALLRRHDRECGAIFSPRLLAPVVSSSWDQPNGCCTWTWETKPKRGNPDRPMMLLMPHILTPWGWFLFLKTLQECMKRFHPITPGETLCRVRNCKSPMYWTRCSSLTTDFVAFHLFPWTIPRPFPDSSWRFPTGIVGKHEGTGNSQETSASYVRPKMSWIT